MNKPPERGGDPDATVMIPAGKPAPSADSDATVMQPARRPDSDETVMIPAGGPDPDATVMVPSAPDPDATVMVPAQAPDPDATIAVRAEVPDPDATVAIPTPGRRRDPGAAAAPGAAPSTSPVGSLGGLNPLVEAANPILAVVAQIRHTLKHSDPEGLRATLRDGLSDFERLARAAGTEEQALSAASYALCALIDESASCTPWGNRWSKEGLLAERRRGGDGGEQFFDLLSRATAEPVASLDLLEFFQVCLALGFEGRYRGSDHGREELGELRSRLRGRIREYRPSYDGELSARWRGVAAPMRRPRGGLGFWAAGCGAALLLAGVYLGYALTLSGLSDPVARELAQLKAVTPEIRRVPGAGALAATQAIGSHLAAEIGRGEVAISDTGGQCVIVIRSDRLFASGSARLERDLEPVILRVAEALDRVAGTVLVTGHTDDVPIRTARFPSNWELSTERASSVVKLVSTKLGDAARLRAEGLADSEPLAPNDSSANRARNRRVVIILRSTP